MGEGVGPRGNDADGDGASAAEARAGDELEVPGGVALCRAVRQPTSAISSPSAAATSTRVTPVITT